MPSGTKRRDVDTEELIRRNFGFMPPPEFVPPTGRDSRIRKLDFCVPDTERDRMHTKANSIGVTAITVKVLY